MVSSGLIYLSAGPTVRADSGTTCIQCDQNNVNGLSNCSANQSTCNSNCNNQYNACVNGGGDPTACANSQNTCLTNCGNTYDNCVNSSWNGYDNCLYGFMDFSGICSIVSQPGYPPPSRRGRTPCDFACRDDMLECRQNGGDTCGQEYNDCKLTCG